MKTQKNSFILYYDMEEQTKALSDAQLGQLLRGIFIYCKNNTIPKFNDDIVEIAFSFIKTTIDINNEKYQERCIKNRENGKKGGRPPKINLDAEIQIRKYNKKMLKKKGEKKK